MNKAKNAMMIIALTTTMIATMFFTPPVITAGQLEPSAGPAPTMVDLQTIYNKLDKPIWDLSSVSWAWDADNPRFKIYMGSGGTGDEAVLDRATGLVWSREPIFVDRIANGNVDFTLSHELLNYAHSKILCGSKGWRVPTLEELQSLIDKSQDSPALPYGHPFIIPTEGWGYGYISTTTSGYYSVTMDEEGAIIGSDYDIETIWAGNDYYPMDIRNGNVYPQTAVAIQRYFILFVRGGSGTYPIDFRSQYN